ncbi:tryptophan 2,3-dioxygenase [Crocinitomix catalasitica]|nr:tryptophan 2,3-dioxygenase [Crocinitomix catalasitica]
MEIKDSTLKRVKRLKEKYALIGQDIDSFLDGLIYANPMKYWNYIEVDTLLSLQKPKTDFPDEKIFIVYHQITELYFCLILHELEQICKNGKKITEEGQDLGWKDELSLEFFLDRLKRVNKYFEALTHSFDIMRFGMEKEQFRKFRMSLLSGSGFQTASYRYIEIACCDLQNLVHESKRKELWDSDYHVHLDHVYWRHGAIVDETGEKTLTLRDFEDKYLEDFHEFADEYQPINLWQKYKALPEKDQKNEELIKRLRELDINANVNWPLVHYRTAVRYMGGDKDGTNVGTGGTNWQKYLPPRFQKRMFYPELWSEEEIAEWGKSWVEEVMAESIKTDSKLKDEL